MKKLKPLILNFINQKRQHSLNMFVSIFFMIFLIILANYIVSLHEYRIDLTQHKTFSLSDQSINILKDIKNDMFLIGFFNSNSIEARNLLQLITTMKYYTPKIKFELVDPEISPSKVKQYGIKNNALLIQYLSKSQKTTTLTESSVFNIIKSLISEESKKICFSQSNDENSIHSNEKNDYLVASTFLKNESYTPVPIYLIKDEIPPDCSSLIVSDPKKEFRDNEIKRISAFIDSGKGTLLMLEPGNASSLVLMLRKYNVHMRNDIVVDKISKLYGGDYTVPLVMKYDNHPIVKGFSLPTIFPIARSIGIIDPEDENYKVISFIKSSEDSWGETEIKGGKIILNFDPIVDYKGPVNIGVSVQGISSNVKLVIFGDASFANNNHFTLYGNGDLFLNTVNWLMEDENLISIRPKDYKITPLALTRKQGIFIWVFYFVSIFIIIAIGTTVFIYRKRL